MSRTPVTKEHTRLIIGIGFLTVFSMMLLVTWLSIVTLQAVNSSMTDLVRDAERKTTRAFEMRDAIRQRSAAVRALQIVGDVTEHERAFNRIVTYTQQYELARDELAALHTNRREQALLDYSGKIYKRVIAAYDDVNELFFSVNSDPQALKAAIGKLQVQEFVLMNQLSTLISLERTLAEEALAANQERFHETRRLLLAIVLASFALSLLVSAVVITRVSRANRRIAHLANHDDLTDLHNRRSFEEYLSHAIEQARRSDDAIGLLYLDLDRFKIVNDTCGHHAGDQLLIELTRLMAGRLQPDDVFARVGGDEFAIIAHGRTFDEVRALADDLREQVEAYVFSYETQIFQVSLSIGLVPIDASVESLETLLADVDSACYVAKQSGRNRVHLTAENDQEVVKYRSDIAGVRSIRKALAEERLSLFFQPVFGIEKDGVSMAHCEVLLRIKNENGELLSPARFIPIAEKYNIMSEIDRWVFATVADWLADHQQVYRVPRLLVNISGLSFVDDSFADFVVDRLERGDVDPNFIAFEITETAAVSNLEKARCFVDRVRLLGCRFALDDFGSGFSTFAYLKRMPIDYLKIDGSLVKNLVSDYVDREMVRAINDIGHTVGALTVAEFVEDTETLEVLRAMGIDYAQGYGLRMPAPLSLLVEELESCEPVWLGGAVRESDETATAPATGSSNRDGRDSDPDSLDTGYRKAS